MAYSDEEWDRRITEAIERAVGFYYEKTKDDFQLVTEAIVSLKEQVDNMPTRDEFNELKDDVKIIKIAVTDTNKELHQHKASAERRLTRLEAIA